DALVAALGHLVVIVEETDQAEAYGDEHARPQIAVGEVHPQQHRDAQGSENHQPAHGRRAALGEVGLRTVGADRLALALADSKPADELGPDQKAEEQRRRGGGASTEGDVAKEVEHPGEAKLFGNPEKHQFFPPASASTSAARPMELDPLTSTASPASSFPEASAMAEAVSGTCAILTFWPSAFASGVISSPTRIA